MEAVERRLCPRIPLNVTMSDTDASKLRAIAPESRTVTVPNGVDISHFTPRPDARRPNRVVFLGPTYMYPNRDAVDWFLAEIWARIRAAVPSAWLDLVGKSSATDRTRYESAGQVRVHGYVDDVRPYLASATCSIAPIRIGGGTRLKILDSWSMGTAVVSTSTGCEGLHAADGENILIRDEAEGFAAAVVDVLERQELRERLAAAGRKTAEDEYSWQAIGEGLILTYRSLTER
jgi:glycosyltransferase involved in cell wall biosynthesis